MQELDDRDLLERAKASDHSAYSVIVDRYKDAAYRLSLSILRHPSDAEDALQEAFTKAYIYLDSYSPEFRFYTWFSTIVRNVSLSHLRARDWLVTPLEEDTVLPVRSIVEENPELALLASARADTVRTAVIGLPERYRRVLILRYWHELTYEEIATVTQQSLGAVKTQIRRAKQILGEFLRAPELGLALE
ncbi:MAG TPA: RNA polymerase sigma factor [Chloroflexota bacterium]